MMHFYRLSFTRALHLNHEASLKVNLFLKGRAAYFSLDSDAVNVPITHMQGSCPDHWAFPLIELMMGLGAMEPFGLGHVVNERFALEVRKVHGFRFPRAGQSWKKMRPGSVTVAAPASD